MLEAKAPDSNRLEGSDASRAIESAKSDCPVDAEAFDLEIRLVECPNPHGANARADDVIAAEFDHRDRKHLRLDQMDDRTQAAGPVEIALADVAVDDDSAVLADASEERLDLRERAVLRLVEQDKCIL